jgi:hypothetical protein
MSVGSSEPLWGQHKVSGAEAKEHEDLLSAKRSTIIPGQIRPRLDISSGVLNYVGFGTKGLGEGVDGWIVYKMNYSSGILTGYDVAFGNWTDRASLSYE